MLNPATGMIEHKGFAERIRFLVDEVNKAVADGPEDVEVKFDVTEKSWLGGRADIDILSVKVKHVI